MLFQCWASVSDAVRFISGGYDNVGLMNTWLINNSKLCLLVTPLFEWTCYVGDHLHFSCLQPVLPTSRQPLLPACYDNEHLTFSNLNLPLSSSSTTLLMLQYSPLVVNEDDLKWGGKLKQLY